MERKESLELVLSDEVQTILDHFADLLDIRITFYSLDGERVRRGKAMCNSCYCEMVQCEPERLSRCLAMDAAMREAAAGSDDVISYRCHAGLQECIAPVKVRGRTIGTLMIGQFRIDDRIPEEISGFPAGIRSGLEKAFMSLPCYTTEKFNGVLGLFRTLIDYIAVREFASLRSDHLRGEIDEYISRHLLEDIRLPEMAKKLGRSTSTISQFLRRNYDTNFSDLVIEARLKRAESFWKEHPDAMVSDAAAAAGFKDQFYFSRVFSKRRGISPARYRRQLQQVSVAGKK